MSLCDTQPLANAVLSPDFCAFSLPIEINQARSVIALGTSDVLALERSTSSVVLFTDSDGDGLSDTKSTVAQAAGLNHGLALHGGFLYASSDEIVYRWPYTDLSQGVGDVEVVINNIDADGMGGAPGGHTTRTLAFDETGRIYVSVGSGGNVDVDSFRSRIRRFDLSGGAFPYDFSKAEVFADGVRNEVGLAFDRHGVLWGVENSADNLSRDDLGGDIINEDNPAEELNRFREEDAGSSWGYPYCWTEYSLPEPPGLGRNTAWAWPTFLDDNAITDEECRTTMIPPVISMQAHSAPLGIVFYEWKPPEELPSGCSGGFPREFDGYAFIAFHGSWNREVPTGYKVVYVPMDENGDATGQPVDLLAHEPPNARWEDGFRPVDVDFDDCGRLLVSSDGTRRGQERQGSKIVRIESTVQVTNSTNEPDASDNSTEAPEIPSNVTNMPSQSPTESSTNQPSLDASTQPANTNEPTAAPVESPASSNATSAGYRPRMAKLALCTGIAWLLLVTS